MKVIIKNLLGSFDNVKGGFSARKLTAFAFVIMSAFIHLRYVNEINAIEALIVDVCCVLVALGIITAQNIVDFKNSNNEENK
jgi:hypothetical protein